MTINRRNGISAAIIAGVLSVGSASAADAVPAKPMKFWNLTAVTITELYLAPLTAPQKWSDNQCLHDPDHSVDPDERLKLTEIGPGQYDVRIVDNKNRRCTLHNIEVKSGGGYAFSVSEQDMQACAAGK